MIGITIERNVTSSSMNASVSTKPNTSGASDFIASLKSFEPAVCRPVRPPRSASEPADRRRDDLVAQRRRATASTRVGAVAVERERQSATVLSGLIVDADRLHDLPVASACRAARDRGLDLGRGDVLGLDRRRSADIAPPGNAAWMRS